MRRHVIVMLKEPRPGRVKTRLAAGLGAVGAAWWYRHQCARLLHRVQDPRWALWLAVAPDFEGRASRVWPAHLPRLPQGNGDLGARMGRVMRAPPPGPVLVIGSDIPDITSRHLWDAFRTLGPHRAVIGPSEDGGYWLIGLSRVPMPAGLFEGVRWSSPHACTDTIETLGGLSLGRVAELRDVDSVADLAPRARSP